MMRMRDREMRVRRVKSSGLGLGAVDRERHECMHACNFSF